MTIVAPRSGRGKPHAPTPVYLRGASKPVGSVNGACFEKTITGSKHLLRRPEALAFDVSTLDDAERAGAEYVQVRDSETGTVYRQHIAIIRRYGFLVARGYGRQVALPLTAFSINGQPPELPPGGPVTNQERKQAQLNLFEGAA